MQLLKAHVEWCNKLTTLYAMFGWAIAMSISQFGQGNSQGVFVNLSFAVFFRVMIHLHKDYKK